MKIPDIDTPNDPLDINVFVACKGASATVTLVEGWCNDFLESYKNDLSFTDKLIYLIQNKGEVGQRISNVNTHISLMDEIIKSSSSEAIDNYSTYLFKSISNTEDNKNNAFKLAEYLNSSNVINNRQPQQLKERLSALLDTLTKISADLDEHFDNLKQEVANSTQDEIINTKAIAAFFDPQTNTVAKHNQLDFDNISEQIEKYYKSAKKSNNTEELEKYRNFFGLVSEELMELIINEPLHNLLPETSDNISLEEKFQKVRTKSNSIFASIQKCKEVIDFIDNKINELNNPNYQQTVVEDDIVQ